jgi:hypothetical protein
LISLARFGGLLRAKALHLALQLLGPRALSLQGPQARVLILELGDHAPQLLLLR